MSGLGLDPVLFLMACVVVALVLGAVCVGLWLQAWFEDNGVPSLREVTGWMWGDR